MERGVWDGRAACFVRRFFCSQPSGFQRMKAGITVRGIKCGAAILAGLASCALAGETRTLASAFTSTMARISVMPDVSSVPVEWKYTNHWDFPLLVEKFDQSCGCLSGKMNPEGGKPIAPGQSGVIRAAFTPGAYRGLVRKSLHVRFVGHERPVELVVEAQVPYSVELSAREITWKADAADASQIIDVTSGTGVDFTITGLGGVSATQFQISQKTVEPSRHYRLVITPADGVAPGVHTLLVRTDSPDPRDRVTAVFLRIP